MLASSTPKALLPATAYYDRQWFEREQERVMATTWHRGELGATTDRWEGMTFASQRPTRCLHDALGALPEWIGSFRPSRLVEVARIDFEGRFNWKLFIENHIDVLHLWYLHASTLNGFEHNAFEHRALGLNWASWEPARSDEATMTTAPIRHLDERDRAGLGAHLLFPDTPFAAAASFFATYRARGVGPDRTVVELRVLAEADADPQPIVAEIQAFIEEDIQACERIQLAVRSRHFEIGPLAHTHEAPIAHFQRHLLALMSDARRNRRSRIHE